MSQELDALKRDEAALWRAAEDLGCKRGRDPMHNSCPFCHDETGFWITTCKDGVARWRCEPAKSQACQKGASVEFAGTIIDLLMRAKGISDKEACKLALERYGHASPSAARGGSVGDVSPGAAGDAAKSKPRREGGKRYASAMEAITALQFMLGKQGAKLARDPWKYTDAAGVPMIEILRFNFPAGKKEFRPLHRDGQGWRIGLGSWGKEQPCPLYNLPSLTAAAGTAGAALHVSEGEKCADALAELRYLVTTSQGGSGRARETDWTPAAAIGRVVIWQDVDAAGKDGMKPGERYANDVAGLIADAAKQKGWQCPEILIVDLGRPCSVVQPGAGDAPSEIIEQPAILNDGQDVYDAIADMKTEGKDDTAIRSGLDEYARRYGRRWMRRMEINYPGQPMPFPGLAADGQRPEISNYEMQSREVKNDKGETESKKVQIALPIQAVVNRVSKLTEGWPCRVRSIGSRLPLLFIDEVERSEVRFLTTEKQFETWLFEIGTPRFNTRQDRTGANYVGPGHTFHSFGGAKSVREYAAIQPRPHEPLLPGHYYTWRPPADYAPDGRRFAGLLKFFTNAKDAASRAIIAAAFMTPGWGGPYGRRPMFCVTAPDRGCGKSTLAWAVGKLWGRSVSVDFSQRGEDQLLGRLLSPEALLKVVCLIDNVKGSLSNAKLEALTTDEWLNGHRLYGGDASRPNVVTWFITANGVQLSRDLALRSYFIELTKPQYSPNWDKKLAEYVMLYSDEIIADIIFILRTAQKGGIAQSDRWPRWGDEVLSAACSHPALAGAVGVDANEVLKVTAVLRDECDQDRDEIEMFVRGLLARICGDPGERYGAAKLIYYAQSDPLSGLQFGAKPTMRTFDRGNGGGYLVTHNASEDFFVGSEEMMIHWNGIMGKKLNAKQIKKILREAREAGRLADVIGKELELGNLKLCRIDEKKTEAGNGYEVGQEVLQAYVDKIRKEVGERQAAVVVG